MLLETNRKKRELLARLTMCHLNSVGTAVNHADIRAIRLRLQQRHSTSRHTQNIAEAGYDDTFPSQLHRFVNFCGGNAAYTGTQRRRYFTISTEKEAHPQ